MNVHISQMVTCVHICLARDEKQMPLVCHAVVDHIRTCTTLSDAFDPFLVSVVSKQNFDFKLHHEALSNSLQLIPGCILWFKITESL